MAKYDPMMDEAFHEYAGLRLSRHYLLMEEKDDSDEAAEVEARMEKLWPSFDDKQRQSLSGMGSDLNWILRKYLPAPKGRQTANEVPATDLEELYAARQAIEWHRILHYLRLCTPCFRPASLATERRTAYDAIGLPQYANVFAQAVEYEPVTPVIEIPDLRAGTPFVRLSSRFPSNARPKCSARERQGISEHWRVRSKSGVAADRFALV
jgi:hypothetical protein